MHRDVEGWIVDAALSPLHPVNDAVSVGIRLARTAHGCAGIVREFAEIVHKIGEEATLLV